MNNTPKWIIIHSSDVSRVSASRQFDAINRYHRDVRGFPQSSLGYFVGYHSLIEASGEERIARIDSEEGAHCNQQLNGVSLNFQSLGVCLSFDGDIEMPTDAQIRALRARLYEWSQRYRIPIENIVLHRKFTPWKTCAGALIPDNWGQTLLTPPKKEPDQRDKQLEIERLTKQISILQRIVELLKALRRFIP